MINNIDEDIKLLKSMNDGYTFQYCRVCTIKHKYDEEKGVCKSKECDYLNAIENVLSELERYKRIANMNLKDSEEFNKNMCEHRCPIKSDYEEVKAELETYKKIAEKLADYIMDIYESRMNLEIITGLGGELTFKDVIDWARKEVEK